MILLRVKKHPHYLLCLYCRPTNNYIYIQEDLKELFSSMQEFVVKDEFKTHIEKDAFDMDKIEEKLKLRENDVMKTECPIVIAGKETS